jgi:hypothetical protein
MLLATQAYNNNTTQLASPGGDPFRPRIAALSEPRDTFLTLNFNHFNLLILFRISFHQLRRRKQTNKWT